MSLLDKGKVHAHLRKDSELHHKDLQIPKENRHKVCPERMKKSSQALRAFCSLLKSS